MSTPDEPLRVPQYLSDTDFTSFSLQDADFASILRANLGKFDFHRADHVKQLTKTILKLDFGLRIDLPDDRLCPPIPVRYNYVRWIQDLLDTTDSSFSDQYDPKRVVTGLDIGVGSSNIYSLLCLKSRQAWRMCGTDIDETNFNYAQKNADENGLSQRMRLLRTEASGSLFPLDELGVPSLDFTICNPPFFVDREEMAVSLSGEHRSTPPSAVCTGAEIEMVTEGGDLGFVLRMVEQSLTLKDRVQWFSSMLGKFKSLEGVAMRLKELGVHNTAVCALRAGGRTTRWAIAWSFQDRRPTTEVTRRDMTVFHVAPFPTEYTIALEDIPMENASQKINRAMNDLDLSWAWNASSTAGICHSPGNVWSRAARREKKRREVLAGQEHPKEGQRGHSPDSSSMAFGIVFQEDVLVLRWLKGLDQIVWESFCGTIHRLIRGNP